MCMVQKRLKLKPSLGGHWRVGIQDEQGTHSSCRVCIQTVGYAFKISRVLIQDVDPSFTLCCVCEVGWLPILQVFNAALRCQSCFCIKTIQSEAKAFRRNNNFTGQMLRHPCLPYSRIRSPVYIPPLPPKIEF